MVLVSISSVMISFLFDLHTPFLIIYFVICLVALLGVGSFHQHRLIPRLLDEEMDNRVVYCIDYLGQGRSWPVDCQDGKSENEKGLIYSADT